MAAVYEADHQAEIPDHYHDRLQLCFVLGGSFEEQVGGERLRCRPGALVVHGAGVRHSNRMGETGARCLNVAYDPALAGAAEAGLGHGGFIVTAEAPPAWAAFRLFNWLQRPDSADDVEFEELVRLLLDVIVGQPRREIAEDPPPWLLRVRTRVADDPGGVVGLSELARDAGVHRGHLARSFRCYFGCTVGEYIRLRRVRTSWRMIVEGDHPLSRIALAAGFTDQAHMTRTFRDMAGVTPGALRAAAAGYRGDL